MESSLMSIMHLSYGTVNARTQLRLQILDQSLLPLGSLQREYWVPPVQVKVFQSTGRWSCSGFFDNNSVVENLSIRISVLNKRKNDIYYHKLKEDQTAGVFRVGWIPGQVKLSDLFTKTTMPVNTRHNLVGSIFLNTPSPIGGIEKFQVNFSWAHLSTSHTTRLIMGIGFGHYIFFIQIYR